MRGSIINRNGHYSVVLDLGKDSVTGKRKQQWISVKGNKKEAERVLAESINNINKGTFVKPDKASLSEYLKSWLTDYCKPNLSPRTHQLYSYISEKHIIPLIGNVPISELKPQHLQRLYNEKLSSGLSNRTVQIIHTTLHKALKNGVKTGILIRNVAEAADPPQAKRPEMRTMNENDLQNFLEAIKLNPYYPLFYTILFTGMRRSEAIAVRWSDIDLLLCKLSVNRSMQQLYNVAPEERITFKEPKTAKSRRSIDLTPSNAIVLRKHWEAVQSQRKSLGLPPLNDNDLVFSQYDGKPLLPDSVTHIWMKLVRKCGLTGIRLHDARHTHASLFLKYGVHPKIVQERLGHSSIAITLDLYSHVAPGMQAAAANKFDEMALSKASKLDRELKEIVR